jgi:polyisoprenoid-binding protein YceI
MRRALIIVALATAAVAPVFAQGGAPQLPGAADVSRVQAGNYKIDSAHSQVAWTVNHFGFNAYHGIFGDITGTLTIDPANPSAASVNVTIPIAKVVTTSEGLTKHLLNQDFFEVTAHPTATFVSTRVVPSGTNAKIEGNLTLRGVTRPVVLDARFIGAGDNPMSKVRTVGFEATTQIRRSDFGIKFGVPMVSDEVDLRITAAFERQG